MKLRVFTAITAMAVLAIGVFAQSREDRSNTRSSKWVISAKAGGVNYIEGNVTVLRQNGRSGMLLKGDEVEIGDKVSTGANAKAEILLNPGSFARIGENTDFEFTDTSLENMGIKLHRGTLILEVLAANEFRVNVRIPSKSIEIVKTGVYRIDVSSDTSARVEVWKGKAIVDTTQVKGGKAIEINGQLLAVAKFDRDERDPLEDWSRSRSKELAKATTELRNREVRNALMNSFASGRLSLYDSFGAWVYSGSLGRWLFLPFGYSWSSPYGFGYPCDIWQYRIPLAYFYPTRPTVAGTPTVPNPSGGSQPTVPPAGNPPSQPPTSPRGRNVPVGERKPPFMEVGGGLPPVVISPQVGVEGGRVMPPIGIQPSGQQSAPIGPAVTPSAPINSGGGIDRPGPIRVKDN